MMNRMIATGTATGILLAAASFITLKEGVVLKTYLDTGNVVTACMGKTGDNLRLGMTFTIKECQEYLKGDVLEAYNALKRNVKVPLPDSMAVALTSFVYNVGEAQFKRSTLLRLLNQGKY